MQATAVVRGPHFGAGGVVGGWIVLASVAALAVSLAWWQLMAPGAGASKRDELVIAAGTGEAIAKGYPVFLPAKVSLRPGGELRLVNEDSVEHTVGEVIIPPGQTAILSAPQGEGDVSYSCTIHPGGSLSFQVAQRPALWQAIAGGVATGIVMGGVAGGVTLIARKLDAD